MNPLQLLSSMDLLERHWHDRQLSGVECLDCLMGALGVTLSTDKTTYRVGERPTYRISGGVPNGGIAWTSFKNGQSTQEFQADYGQDLNAAGTVTLEGGAWTTSDIGNWQKQVLIVPPDYAGDYSTLATGQVSFSVVGASAASASPAAQQSQAAGGFLNQQVDLPIVGKVPVIAVAGVGLVLVFAISGSGGKR